MKKILKVVFLSSLFLSLSLNPVFAAKKTSAKNDSGSKQDDDLVSTTDAMQEIERSLFFSNKNNIINTSPNKNSKEKDEIEINRATDKPTNSGMEIIVADPKNNQKTKEKEKIAYGAAVTGQYEVAIEMYKQILKSEPDNDYAKFGLAVSYQKLGQYKQAKKIYYDLLKTNPVNKEEIIGNLLAIITDESPNDAIYLLSKLASQNPDSSFILAQAGVAYDKAGKSDQAILLLNKAIAIDSQIEYIFNLAVIYDKNDNYQKALALYQDILKNYTTKNSEVDGSIPINQIKQRIEYLKNKS